MWPRQIPVEGEPADVTAIVEAYGQWLAHSAIPQLLILGDPGAIITGRHFLQEDSPRDIGRALDAFMTNLPAIR